MSADMGVQTLSSKKGAWQAALRCRFVVFARAATAKDTDLSEGAIK